MKLHVVYDPEGKIVAASIADIGPPGSPVPQAGPGQKYATLDVPAQLHKLAFHEIIERVAVDLKSAKLVSKV
jgi:hypothetical protein